MKEWLWVGCLCLLCGCATTGPVGGSKQVLLCSTIGPVDAGIVDALEKGFGRESGIRVRHVGAGTGAVLAIAKKGNVDLAMVHAKAFEEQLVAEGFGTERIDIMYNDFVITGPARDLAGIKGMASATEALRTIAQKQATFVTRGDKSGTHMAELALWEKAGIKPAGSWYSVFEKGAAGNVPTLEYADQKGAYTVIDRATFLTLKDKIKLVLLVEKDEALLNYISLIPVNPRKFPGANYADAMRFVQLLTDPENGQKIIRDFGRDKYGSPLFFPNSKEWRQTQGKKS